MKIKLPKTEKEYDDLVDEWHASDTTKELYEFLEMTKEQWEAYLMGNIEYATE